MKLAYAFVTEPRTRAPGRCAGVAFVLAASWLLAACAPQPDTLARGPDSDAAAASAQPPPLAEPDAVEGVAPEGGEEDVFMVERWIAELDDGQSRTELLRVSDEALAGTPSVEPLFPDTRDERMARIFVVRADTAVAEPEAWDLARSMRDAGSFLHVEPDLEDQSPPGQRAAAAACFVEDGVPAPLDPAWSLREIRAPEAWALEPPSGGARFGTGVRVCHPDTGWTEHGETDQARLDLGGALDLVDGSADARDPLGYSGNPGHGTATGSVIASAGGVAAGAGTTPPGRVTGVAPGATLVPIRAIRSVVRFMDSNVAKAVAHAQAQQCDVVSMSLGGRVFFGLEAALESAVDDDMLVVSAAGNCVGFMVAPAVYDETVAAAASNAEHLPWNGSSRGRAVTLTAPGEDVYVARRGKAADPMDHVEASNGTSFATAEIAGAAALWIAFHGRERLRQARGGQRLHDLFVWALRASADDRGGSWDTRRFGAGILDVEALLKVDLDGFDRDAPRRARRDTTLALFARSLDLSEAAAGRLLTNLFGEGDGDAEQLADRYGPELHRHLVSRPALFDALRTAAEQRASGTELRAHTGGLSSSLRSALRD